MSDAKPTAESPIACRPGGRLFVERFAEPFTGMEMLGVGGHWFGRLDDAATSVEILYGGGVRSDTLAKPTAETDGEGRVRFDFSTQLPREAGDERVTVRLRCGDNTETIYDRDWRNIPGQESSPSEKPSAIGRLFSPRRWLSRVARVRSIARQLRQRFRHKLLARRHRPGPPHDGFVRATRITPRMRTAMADIANSFAYRPKISILMPVYNVDPKWLDAAITSVRDQIYDNWELCLADDSSTLSDLVSYLDWLPKDRRIKLVRRDENGHISAASNSAAAVATGDFVALMDNDDELAPEALFEVVSRLQERPDADLVYSDEDKIDVAGQRYDPQFKPDWSPELLLAYNYVNHFTVIRRSIFEKAGRFRIGYEGSQDHDLLLRVIGLTDRVEHIPRILYHWRSLPESTAAAATVKPFVHTSGRQAIGDHLWRHGIAATPYQPEFARKLGLPILCYDWPDVDASDDGGMSPFAPRTSVFPHATRTATPACGPDHRESPAPRSRSERRQSCSDLNRLVHPIQVDDTATAGRLNAEAERSGGEWLLFLRKGATPNDDRWLSRLVGHASLPGVGAVGAAIEATDGSLLASGIVLGMRDGTAPANAFHGLRPGEVSYYFQAEVTRPVSAVGIDCLLTRRCHFDRLGGFDDRFPNTLFDVDYCMRLAAAGLRTLAVGEVRLTRTDVATACRDNDRCDDPGELLEFRRRYGRPRDRYYNANLSEGRAYRIAADGPLTVPSVLGSPPVKTLVATHNLNKPEGAPRYLYEIVVGLKQRGRTSPVIFSPVAGEGESAYRDAGVLVMVAEMEQSPRFTDGRWSPLEYDSVQRRLAELLREQKPEAVIANTLVCFPLVEAAARAGIPSLWIIHESYSPEHMARVFSPFARARCEAAFSLATRVIPASHDTAALFQHLNTRGNFTVLHNGLIAADFDAYLRNVSREEALSQIPHGDTDQKRIISVGTVCERKGQHTIIEAAARLAQTRRDFRCYLVGLRPQVPYANYCRHLVEHHRLHDVVELVPETDNVRAFYRSADVFVCSSAMEAFSRSMLEAEAFGLPIVSTACPGVSEQVFWGENALRFDFGDADTLAEHLRTMLDGDALRREMGRKSRAAFDNHLSYDEMLDRYERVLLSAARHGPRDRLPIVPAAVESPIRKVA